MATKKKKKPELEMVGALVPPHVARAVEVASDKDNRSKSGFVRMLIENAPQVQAALRKPTT